jgi:uncharacterized protein with PIN domain
MSDYIGYGGQIHRRTLLFKGDDFRKTDLQPALI